jgi:hypothetical protein
MADMKILKISSQLGAIINYLPISAVLNVYTLDLRKNYNFSIETTDVNSKTLSFSNVPTTQNSAISLSVYLKFTNNAAITFPASVTWQNGIVPTFNAGKKYILMFTSFDNGVSWLGSYVGEW